MTTPQTTPELPTLPEPDGYAAISGAGTIIVPPRDFAKHNAYAVFTADQMREYARAALAASPGVSAAPLEGAKPVHWRALLSEEQRPQQPATRLHVVGFGTKQAAETWVLEQREFKGWNYTLEDLYAAPQPPASVQPLAVGVGIGIVCKTAPESIWLQVDPECDKGDEPVYPGDNIGEVSWCWHAINDSDTKYIRADLANPQRPETEWQPIETVPQSEDRFLVISRSGRITIDTGHFMHNMMHAAKVDGDECFYTNWAQLPKAPEAGITDSGIARDSGEEE